MSIFIGLNHMNRSIVLLGEYIFQKIKKYKQRQ